MGGSWRPRSDRARRHPVFIGSAVRAIAHGHTQCGAHRASSRLQLGGMSMSDDRKEREARPRDEPPQPSRRTFVKTAGLLGVASAMNPWEVIAEATSPPASGEVAVGQWRNAAHDALSKRQSSAAARRPATSAPRLPARRLRSRHEEGLRPRPVRRVHGARRRRRVNSCLSLAVMHEGDEITTIEGSARRTTLHPMQAAFVEHERTSAATARPGRSCPPWRC